MTLNTKRKTIFTAIIGALTMGTAAYGDTPISSIGSLGELNVSSGYVVFNTNEGSYSINGVKQSGSARFTTLPENSGGIEHQAFEIPVYDFTTIELAKGVNVFAEGEYGLTLLASESVNLGANLDLSGIDGEDGDINAGGGGGGGGGVLSIFANNNLTFNGTIDVSGGNGGLSYQKEGNSQGGKGGKGVATGGDGGTGGYAIAGGRGGMGGQGSSVSVTIGFGGGGGGGGGYSGTKGSGNGNLGNHGNDGDPGNCPNQAWGGKGGTGGGGRFSGAGGLPGLKDGMDGTFNGAGGGGAGGDAPNGTNGGVGGRGGFLAGGGGGGGGGDLCGSASKSTLNNGGGGGGGGGSPGAGGEDGRISSQDILLNTSFTSGGGGGAGQVFLGTNSGILFYEGTIQALGGFGYQSAGGNGSLVLIYPNEEDILISSNGTSGVNYRQDLSLSDYLPVGGGGGAGAGGPGVPLLVELSKFIIATENGKIFIIWTTALENENAGFRLWRATRNQYDDYEPTLLKELGRSEQINPTFNENCSTKIQGQLKADNSNKSSKLISAIGNSTESTCYSFTDTSNLSDETYYYLLEDIDDNGNSTFHCDHIDAVTVGQGPAIDLPSAINFCKEITNNRN